MGEAWDGHIGLINWNEPSRWYWGNTMLETKTDVEVISPQRKYVGLVDGGKTTLKCSACDKPLAIVWLIKPHTKGEAPWKVKAKCCYCEDESFPSEVPGKWSYAGYHKANEDNVDEVKPVTNLLDIQYEGDVVTIFVKEIK